MCAKTINLLCSGNEIFVKHQAQGGELIPTPLAYALVLSNIRGNRNHSHT